MVLARHNHAHYRCMVHIPCQSRYCAWVHCDGRLCWLAFPFSRCLLCNTGSGEKAAWFQVILARCNSTLSWFIAGIPNAGNAACSIWRYIVGPAFWRRCVLCCLGYEKANRKLAQPADLGRELSGFSCSKDTFMSDVWRPCLLQAGTILLETTINLLQ